MARSSYEAFFELVGGLEGYISEISPYVVDGSQTILSGLPTELRWEIYEYLLPDKNDAIQCHTNFLGPSWPMDPYRQFCSMIEVHNCGIIHTNESTRIDILHYHIRTRLVCVRGTWRGPGDEHPAGECRNSIIKHLESLPGELGFWSVLRLRLPELTRQIPVPGGSRNDDMDLVTRCRNLYYLGLEFDSRHLLRDWDLEKESIGYNAYQRNYPGNSPPVGASGFVYISAEEAIQRYQLYRVFALTRINNIGLEMHVHDDLGSRFEAMALLEGIGQCLDQGFRMSGRDVKIETVCHFWASNNMLT